MVPPPLVLTVGTIGGVSFDSDGPPPLIGGGGKRGR